MTQPDVQYLRRDDGPDLAYVYSPARDDGPDLPTIMFCGGFKSDMQGTKATYFEQQLSDSGQAYVRFDYSGHGQSEGNFKDGTIGAWLDDALAIFDHVVKGPVIVVGSSMGGWIGLLMAQARQDDVKGFIGIAAAPDFTVRLYDEELSDGQREAIQSQGYLEVPNDYSDEPYIFTKRLFDDGKKHLLLTQEHQHTYPIMLFHGLRDETVPKESPLAIRDRYQGGPLDVVFVEDGDHSLSRSEDLEMMIAEIKAMSRSQDL